MLLTLVNKSRLFIDDAKKTWPHAGLNPGLPQVSLTLYRYTNWVRGILRSSAIYIRSEVIPVGRLVIRPTVGRLGHILDDRLLVG